MPISEDEFDCPRNSQDPPSTTMSKAELRKTHKPIMEKRRRARINQCLNEIKTLILEAMNKDPARHSKLEKADILEMAVKHLQNSQKQQLAMAMSTDPSVLRKFKSGFNECTKEIDNYIGTLDGIDPAMKQRITAHLQKCIGGIEQLAQFNFPGFGNLPFITNTAQIFNRIQSGDDHNNNPTTTQLGGIQLIPSRLPSGELALLLPNSSALPYFPQQCRSSAFTTVVPQHSNAKTACSSSDDHQVPHISSSSTSKVNVKNTEPLCIITNQSERYKQAQVKEDSAFFEENIQQQHYGRLKRMRDDFHDFTTDAPPMKMVKTSVETTKTMEQHNDAESKDFDSNDMWRPW